MVSEKWLVSNLASNGTNVCKQLYWLLLRNLKTSLAQEQSDGQELFLENGLQWEELMVHNVKCCKNDMFMALLSLYILWVEKYNVIELFSSVMEPQKGLENSIGKL